NIVSIVDAMGCQVARQNYRGEGAWPDRDPDLYRLHKVDWIASERSYPGRLWCRSTSLCHQLEKSFRLLYVFVYLLPSLHLYGRGWPLWDKVLRAATAGRTHDESRQWR